MKSMIFFTLSLLSLGVLGTTQIKFPSTIDKGFENVNGKKEYTHYGYGEERIWREFGRPFWRAEGSEKKMSKAKPEVKKETVVEQKVQEKRSAAMKEVNSQYNPETKDLRLDVKFDLNRANLKQDYTSMVNKLGKVMKENRNIRIEINGHTDTTGSFSYNKDLSEKRAAAVKRYLQKNFGIEKGRMISAGYGPTKPMFSNETREGREKNRRVMVKLLD